jgi:hypothetical protein
MKIGKYRNEIYKEKLAFLPNECDRENKQLVMLRRLVNKRGEQYCETFLELETFRDGRLKVWCVLRRVGCRVPFVREYGDQGSKRTTQVIERWLPTHPTSNQE